MNRVNSRNGLAMTTAPQTLSLVLVLLLGHTAVLRRCGLFLHMEYSVIGCLSVCQSLTLVTPAKTAKPIEIPFATWIWVCPSKHVLDGVHIGTTWRIQLNRRCAAVMRLYVNYFDRLLRYSSEQTDPCMNIVHTDMLIAIHRTCMLYTTDEH